LLSQGDFDHGGREGLVVLFASVSVRSRKEEGKGGKDRKRAVSMRSKIQGRKKEGRRKEEGRRRIIVNSFTHSPIKVNELHL
jgi:hypothetical protein